MEKFKTMFCCSWELSRTVTKIGIMFTTDNFSELASQTEKFAAKLNKNNGRGASPDTLSTNSRSSSYSSVVSNGAGNGAPGTERGNARQTIPRLALNVDSKKNPYETKHPGW